MTGGLFALSNGRLQALSAAVQALCDMPYISCPFFTEDEVQQMRKDVSTLPFRDAQSVVGNGVHQDFQVCFPAPRIASLDAVASLLEKGLNQIGQKNDIFESDIVLNDCAVQRYHAQSRGIGIHKDGLRYRNIVIIITLSGTSTLYGCTTREGAGRQVIDDGPGQLVLLAAPGFKGLASAADRPLHGVDNVTDGRLSIGLRSEQLKS